MPVPASSKARRKRSSASRSSLSLRRCAVTSCMLTTAPRVWPSSERICLPLASRWRRWPSLGAMTISASSTGSPRKARNSGISSCVIGVLPSARKRSYWSAQRSGGSELAALSVELAGGAVEQRELALGVAGHDALAEALEQPLGEAPLVLESELGLPALGHVLDLGDEVHRAEVLVADQRAGQVRPHDAAVGKQVALLPPERRHVRAPSISSIAWKLSAQSSGWVTSVNERPRIWSSDRPRMRHIARLTRR